MIYLCKTGQFVKKAHFVSCSDLIPIFVQTVYKRLYHLDISQNGLK